ncbi:MAG: cysteine desulfurase family protein [Alphaproteobacteria bacterium]
MTHAVYMDYNATAPLRPRAVEAMGEALARCGNPSSVHRFGRLARRAVEDARERVAALIGARASEIVFTSGGTEANAVALNGAGRTRLIVSSVEHDSVLRNAPAAELVPVDGDGIVDVGALARMLADDREPALVSVMLANNETGVIEPVAEVVRVAHAAGALVHCDAVQAAGKIPVDVGALGVDLMTISAHKLGGPQGAGALFVADHVTLEPTVRGGGQERGRRAGTENVPGIVGFGAAAQAARAELADFSGLARLRDQLESRVKQLGAVTVFGANAPRLPNTACLAQPGASAETLVIAFDLAGIAVSAGAACSSGKVEPSRVLRAMGALEGAGSAIRVSLGWDSHEQDIDAFVDAWGRIRAGRRAHAAPAA